MHSAGRVCARTERVTCEKLTQVDAVVAAGAEAEAEAEAEMEEGVVVAGLGVEVALGRGGSSSSASGDTSSHMAESRYPRTCICTCHAQALHAVGMVGGHAVKVAVEVEG